MEGGGGGPDLNNMVNDDGVGAMTAEDPCWCRSPGEIRRRLWTFLGIMLVYMLRVNLSVAIIDMADQFGWDEHNSDTSGFELSAFFIGYVFGQVPGGALSGKFGAKWVFGLGVLASGVLTFLVPITVCGSFLCPSQKPGANGTIIPTPSSVLGIDILRIFMGMFESVTYPAMMALLSTWSPPSRGAGLSVFASLARRLALP